MLDFLPPRRLPPRWARPFRFAAVGVANTLVDVGVFAALVAASVPVVAANAVGYAAGTLNSFVLNRVWTFRDLSGTGQGWGRQFAAFAGVNLAVLGLSTCVVWGLAPLLGPVPAKLASVPCGFAAGYALTRVLVFRAA